MRCFQVFEEHLHIDLKRHHVIHMNSSVLVSRCLLISET